MDTNTLGKLSDKETNAIMKDYQEKADQIIRKMFGVLIQANKKVDELSYRQWVDTLKKK